MATTTAMATVAPSPPPPPPLPVPRWRPAGTTVHLLLLLLIALALAAVQPVIATVNWQAWNNTALGPAAAAVLTTVACVNATGTAAASGNYTSVAVVGNIISPITDLMVFTVVTDGAVRLWMDDNLLVDNSTVDVAPPRGLVAIAGVPFTAGVPRTLRLEYSHWTASSPALALWWQGNVTAAAVVPPDAYTATITSAQIERAAVRDRLYAPAVAWGTYNNPSMGDHVHHHAGRYRHQ